ncbi:MAG: ATP-binding protein [Propionibacteriaceae bacterium]|nr:ATP-binding protein [Propionibacteriaceae bacterium]
MLIRESYLERLRPLYEVPDIVKVLTGVRRCGKSVLLRQIQDDLRQTVPSDRIISINFELLQFAELATAERLEQHVRESVADPSQLNFVFLDEIQEVDGFEKAVNSLRASGNFSVFITGSNAHLMDGDLATYLAGRYIEVKVWPLSFAESLEMPGQGNTDTPTALNNYLQWGGMPFRFFLDGEAQQSYLRDAFNSVVLRDVVQRAGVRDVAGLEMIIDFSIENMGRVMSPSSLLSYLKSVGKTLSTDAIYAYLRALDGSMLLNRVRRYDLRGKKVMSTLDKYYATDIGLLTSKKPGAGPGQGDLVENCVFVELVRRGFDVFTGIGTDYEIDFVASRNGKPRYVQTAYLIGSPDVAAREFGALAKVKDNYPRYVISMDPLTMERDGIEHLSLQQFLLDPPEALRG